MTLKKSLLTALTVSLMAVALGGILGFDWQGAEIDDDFFLGGIQVNEPDHEHWVRTLEASGMNTVSVTVYAHQGNWDTDHIWFDEENDAVLNEIRTAKAAGLKVVLILRVALDHAFEANRFLWHGMIQPRTPEMVESWFRQYTDFAVTWGRTAQAEGVDLLGIASEMNELTSTLPLVELPPLHEFYLNEEKQAAYRERILAQEDGIAGHHLEVPGSEGLPSLEAFLAERQGTYRDWAQRVTDTDEVAALEAMNERRRLLDDEWVRLIERVRAVYSGRLTYAANFDQYQDVGFWRHLDVLSINAYFPLRSRWGPESRPEFSMLLEAGWRRILAGIVGFRKEQGLEGLPVVFSELGYTSRQGCTLEPWASGGFSVVDEGRWLGREVEPRLVIWGENPLVPRERALAVQGLRQAAEEVAPGLLQGLLYWKLSTVLSHRDIEPFVLILGEETPDPLLVELQRFRRSLRMSRPGRLAQLWREE